jgi:hypothetical protein
MRRRSLKILFALPLVASLSALTACEDDPVEPEEPEIGTVRLTIGSQTVNLAPGATVSVTVSGATNAVSATFLGEDGSALTLDGSEFELRLIPRTTGRVTYTRSASFSGSLARVAAGSVLVDVQIFHLIENHEDFEAVLNMTVQ